MSDTNSQPQSTLPCIRCDKKLESIFKGEDDSNQPYAGTTFTSYGHYGSTVFDPMDGESFLELNICDECLREAAAKQQILLGRKEVRTDYSYDVWDLNK